MSSMDEIEVPSYFICPISLQIMKDPVILSTGISYDRESIEKWLFVGNHNTCPVTKQELQPDPEITPNHTLRRLIQAWCTLNSSHGAERFPTPKPPVSKAHLLKLVKDVHSPSTQLHCLRTLRSIATENEANKRSIEASAALDFLLSVVNTRNFSPAFDRTFGGQYEGLCDGSVTSPCDEALAILHMLQLSQTSLTKIAVGTNGKFLESLAMALGHGSYESRAYAVMLLKSTLPLTDSAQLTALEPRFFVELMRVLQDRVSPKVSKAALQILIEISQLGRNRLKAVEAGGVHVLVEYLLEATSSERRSCEMVMVAMDQLCRLAEGRAELVRHQAGMAVVSKKILRVSEVASERGMRILHNVLKHSATGKVVQEALLLGVVAKLCLIVQIAGNSKMKERARELLKLHGKAWKGSPCLPSHLTSSYT